MKSAVRNLVLAGALTGVFVPSAHATLVVGILETTDYLVLVDTATGLTTNLADLGTFGTNLPNGLAHDEQGRRFIFSVNNDIWSISYSGGDAITGTYSAPSLLWESELTSNIDSGAWYNGYYYFVQNTQLRRISGTTASGTLTPETVSGLPNLGSVFGDIAISDDGFLYISHNNPGQLRKYDLKPVTPTLVFSTDNTAEAGTPRVQLAFGQDGFLYGVEAAGGRDIYRINTNTGAFQLVTENLPYQINDLAEVPEPAILGLLGLGLTTMGLASMRRRRPAPRQRG